MQSSTRLASSIADVSMDLSGDEHYKNKRKGSAQ